MLYKGFRRLGSMWTNETRNEENRMFSELFGVTDSFQQQLDNLVVSSGDSPAEVVQARGEYNLLYERLNSYENKHDETDSIIGDIQSDINKKPTRLSKNITLRVGNNEDYKTINEALSEVTSNHLTYKNHGYSVVIYLVSGFKLKEQIEASGIDLGWIRITSEDEIVYIDKNKITQEKHENRKPIFFGTNNATLPVIDCLFEYDNGNNENTDGIMVSYGSKVRLMPGSGVNKADRGLSALYSSEAFCYFDGLTVGGAGIGANNTEGVIFENCTNRAFMASFGSRINCARSKISGCKGDNAVYAIWGSFVDIYQSDVSNATNTAVHSRDGSKINARETNVSNSNRGYHALHGATINARYYENKWSGNGASKCKDYGVLASHNSNVDAENLNVSNSGTGVHASSASTINFKGGKAPSCKIGVSAKGSSNIEAQGVNASQSSDTGVLAIESSRINAPEAIVSNSTNFGMRAEGSSSINAEESTANNCNEGFYARSSSSINLRSATAKNCNRGVNTFENCYINASYFDARGAIDVGIRCIRGSSIYAGNSGGTTQPSIHNEVTQDGIIFHNGNGLP